MLTGLKGLDKIASTLTKEELNMKSLLKKEDTKFVLIRRATLIGLALACVVWVIFRTGHQIAAENWFGENYMNCAGVLLPLNVESTVSDLFVVRTVHFESVSVIFPIDTKCFIEVK
jgi:hypothetical protein